MEDTSRHTLRNLIFLVSLIIIIVGGCYYFSKKYNFSPFKNVEQSKMIDPQKKREDFTKFSGYVVKSEDGVMTVTGQFQGNVEVGNKMAELKTIKVTFDSKTQFTKTTKDYSAGKDVNVKVYKIVGASSTPEELTKTISTEKTLTIWVTTSKGSAERKEIYAEAISYQDF